MLKQSGSQTVGPYFRIGLIYGDAQNVLVKEETQGERIKITGTVFDGDGEPIPDAMIEIWQSDAKGIYNHPLDPRHEEADPHFRGFGRAENRKEGVYTFKTVKPGSHEGEAPYINVRLFARGMLMHAITRLYFADEPANENDAVLNSIPGERRATLLASREETEEFPTYRFDIHVQGEKETVFFNPE